MSHQLSRSLLPAEEIRARQTGNEFFMDDVELDIDAGWWMREPTINLGGLELTMAVKRDIRERLGLFKKQLEDTVKSRALTFLIPELNNPGPKTNQHFARLKSTYMAIAAAHAISENL